MVVETGIFYSLPVKLPFPWHVYTVYQMGYDRYFGVDFNVI